MKMVWFDLKEFCKSYEEIRKQKKEKEERRKINKKAKGKRFSPAGLLARGPLTFSRTGTPGSLSPSLTSGPT
jgi:hypothetical protein